MEPARCSINHLECSRCDCNGRLYASVDTNTGCEKLAIIEENIVTAFNEGGGDSNNAITVTLNRAYRVRATAPHKEVP